MITPLEKMLVAGSGLLIALFFAGSYVLHEAAPESGVAAEDARGQSTALQRPAPTEASPRRAPSRSARQLLPDDYSSPQTEPAGWNPPAGALNNEMILAFASEAEMREFLQRARAEGAEVRGMIRGLNAVRLGVENSRHGARIRDLASDSAETGFNYAILTPDLPNPPQAGDPSAYRAFGADALRWLGVPADRHAEWGNGITVAVLDTDIADHPTFSGGSMSRLNLLENDAGGGSGYENHGTAVASLIAGRLSETAGIAPAAQILGIRVLDGDGTGDSFTVAQGIMEAVDRGANVVSLSLGTYGDSFVLREAVTYALERNVAVVAAAGNEGYEGLPYPAAYEGVLGVTAVDATSRRADFANFGTEVGIAAPGIGVNAAWGDTETSLFSGTSAATPLVSGAIAGLLSENPGMRPAEAVDLLLRHADDAGPAGQDPLFGAGILNMDRVASRDVPGIYDAAVADFHWDPEAGLEISVQNRGTEWLSNVRLDIRVDQQDQTFYFGGFDVGETQSRTLPLNADSLTRPEGVSISSQVTIEGRQDTRPSNNSKEGSLRLMPEEE